MSSSTMMLLKTISCPTMKARLDPFATTATLYHQLQLTSQHKQNTSHTKYPKQTVLLTHPL